VSIDPALFDLIERAAVDGEALADWIQAREVLGSADLVASEEVDLNLARPPCGEWGLADELKAGAQVLGRGAFRQVRGAALQVITDPVTELSEGVASAFVDGRPVDLGEPGAPLAEELNGFVDGVDLGELSPGLGEGIGLFWIEPAPLVLGELPRGPAEGVADAGAAREAAGGLAEQLDGGLDVAFRELKEA
jgi:hypothetical protein